MGIPNRYFGSEQQRGLERRADLLWQLVKDDPKFCFHGRAVGLLAKDIEGTAEQVALARLQGLGPSPRLAPDVAVARKTKIEQAGMIVEVQQHWTADVSAVSKSREFAHQYSLPMSVELREVASDTPAEEFDKLDQLTQTCGILLPAEAFLRGVFGPAACFYARTADGEIIGFAAALIQATCAPSEQRKAWWGFLSTAPNWRKQGIAKFLGAMAIVTIGDRHGLQEFETGILSENTASIRVSKSLGFRASGLLDLLAIDIEVLSAGRILPEC